jgi:hypothetical protein
MQPGALALALLVATASLEPPAPPVPVAPEGLGEVEGRGLGAPGSAAAEIGAGGVPLRFATPAGGAGELVLYLAAVPATGELTLRGSTAVASLLGIPGEIRLSDHPTRATPRAAPLEERAFEPVPEPGVLGLTLLGLGMLARLARRRSACQAAGRWSGPPPG